MVKRLAIIPARSGSKRIKNKNIISFFNKPLIFYSINAAKKSKLFSKIHVSTDSKKIKKIAKIYGADSEFERDKSISDDKTGILEVLNFVIKKYKKINISFDEVWLIYATNPFIESKYLKKANKIYKKNNKKKNIISVSKYNFPIFWAQEVNKRSKFLSPIFKKKIKKDSNTFNHYYCDSGMFVIYAKNFFKKKSAKYIPFEIPWWKSIDIDTLEDLEAAKKIYK